MLNEPGSEVEAPSALTPPAMERVRKFFADLGPGLMTGAADDDPSGISTYSVTGAAFGSMRFGLRSFLFR